MAGEVPREEIAPEVLALDEDPRKQQGDGHAGEEDDAEIGSPRPDAIAESSRDARAQLRRARRSHRPGNGPIRRAHRLAIIDSPRRPRSQRPTSYRADAR